MRPVAFPVRQPDYRDAPALDERDERDEARPRPAPTGRARRLARGVGSAIGWLFGAAVLWLALAVLSAVPLGQFLVLGYLLEAGGRVAREGRLRDGFIGVRAAARWGVALLGCGALWLPLYFISIFVDSARIIDPAGPAARHWEDALTVLVTLAVLHALGALYQGGRVRDFLKPWNILWLAVRVWSGRAYQEARDAVWNAVTGLRLPYYFWLGLRGYLGGFLWLLAPLLLLGSGHHLPLLGVAGGLLLGLVVLYLPFLQVRFARDNRLRAYRMLAAVRATYRRAPLAWALALSLHLLAAIPLYLLKIELIPRDLAFLEGLVFLAFIFPARLLDGWAYARGARKEGRAHWVFRWLGRLAVLPVVAAYVLVVFTSQHIGWSGISSLYEQHAFLLPVPFVSWDR